MNAEIKQKWVEALRSGKYQQGHYALQTGEAYCCLGVLCVVTGTKIFEGNSTRPDDCSYDGILAHGVNNNECARLWAMNDSNRSFAEIADYIEEHL